MADWEIMRNRDIAAYMQAGFGRPLIRLDAVSIVQKIIIYSRAGVNDKGGSGRKREKRE